MVDFRTWPPPPAHGLVAMVEQSWVYQGGAEPANSRVSWAGTWARDVWLWDCWGGVLSLSLPHPQLCHWNAPLVMCLSVCPALRTRQPPWQQ